MSIIQDIRYGVRLLRKSPGFTIVAVLVLTLAIGGTAAMFSVVNALVLRPLPVKEPHRLVRVFNKQKTSKGTYRNFSYPNYIDLRQHNDCFSELMAFTLAMVGADEGDLTRRSFAALVSANYFAAFGVPMNRGRGFLPEEERPGSAVPVVVVSHSYWRKHGSDPLLVGKCIRINSRDLQVVGIAPEYFTGTTALFSPDFWLPLGMYESIANDFMNADKKTLSDRQHAAVMLVGRLKPGIEKAAAQARLATAAARLEAAFPDANKDYTVELGPLTRMSLTVFPQNNSEFTLVSVLLMGMSGSVLLIACLNIANMLLARSAARRREIAIRLSLGAGRGRLVRQLLTEGMLLALLGGAGGVWLASWGSAAVFNSLETKLPFLTMVFDARPDWRVLAVTFGACAISVLIFALGPAWRLTRLNVTSQLKEMVGDELQGKVTHSLFAPRSLLVAGQLALSLALLTAAALFARGAVFAARVNPGFGFDQRIVVESDAALGGYEETASRQAYTRVLERIRTLPGVESASLSHVIPFGMYSDGGLVRLAGTDAKSGTSTNAHSVYANFNIIATRYFHTLGIPLLRGRDFDELEQSGAAQKVVIIDEPLRKELFPKQEALGRYLTLDDKGEPAQVVGIVGGIRDTLGDDRPQSHVYIPFGQRYRAGMNIHVRIASAEAGADKAMVATVRDAIRSVEPHLPLISLQTFRDYHENGVMMWFVRTAARLFGLFGLLALALAAVGVYGLKSYLVVRRTREIGIRVAMGATGRDILWMILQSGIKVTALGLAVGLVLAIGLGFVLRGTLYGLSAVDPYAFTIAPLCLALATMLACYFPARKATKVQPMAALRYE